MSHTTTTPRRGKIDSIDSLETLDLLQFNDGVNPWKDQSVANGFRSGINHYRRVVREAGFVECGHVVDIGCGHGRWSCFLAEANETVHGVDRNEGGLNLARNMCAFMGLDNTSFTVGDVSKVDLPDGSFDGAWCFGVLMLVDRGATLTEIHRLLRPGGRLFVGIYNGMGRMIEKFVEGFEAGGREHGKAQFALDALTRGPDFDGRPNYGTVDAVAAMLERHGFALSDDFEPFTHRTGELSEAEAAPFADRKKLVKRLEKDDAFVASLSENRKQLQMLEYNLDFVAIRK
jgi:SAM-dependent methyltransferase